MARAIGVPRRLMGGTLLVAVLLFGAGTELALGASSAPARLGVDPSRSNAASPLGINLSEVSYASAEQPFLNLFKTNGGWVTADRHGRDTGEERYLDLDANGWPVSLRAIHDPHRQKFTQVTLLLLPPVANTPGGPQPVVRYIVRYRGRGTIKYGSDAVMDKRLSVPGRDVVDVKATAGGGIRLTITNTDPRHTGNYIRDIQVVRAGQERALLSGRVFNPKLLKILKNFRVLRFMDWFRTNGSRASVWQQRVRPSFYAWGTSAGVPYEVAIELANVLSADPWINVPAMADDHYIRQFAALVHNRLGKGQKVYVEYTNEGWDVSSSQGAWIAAQARRAFPSAPGWERPRIWFGMRTAQMCDIWKSVWGSDSARVVCVLGAQAANTWSATVALNCPGWSGAPCYRHHIDAVAIAPYFGDSGVPLSFTTQPDGGLSRLFASLTSKTGPGVPAGGYIGKELARVRAYRAALAPYKLPVITYEGGQSFVGGHSPALTKLYIAANRDPRMAAAYTYYLNHWKQDGGQLFVLYADVAPDSRYGEWGALQSVNQRIMPLSDAPPKWQAIQGFIRNNPCWWPHCVASEAITPLASGHTGKD